MHSAPLIPIVLDVETTGFGKQDRILEIAAIALDPATWETVDEYDTLINPQRDVGPTGVHGISASMVEAAPTFAEIVADVARRLQGTVVIAHHLDFDIRMLRYEFDRCGIPFDAGAGLCTLRETGQKLILACEERSIPLSHQHRALADARATAELARKLNLRDRTSTARPLHIAHIPSTPRHHTMRRGLADEGISPMHRIVSRAHYPHCDEAIQQYLDLLDWVLDDGVIDVVEKREMDLLANDLGIADEAREAAHMAYLDCIIKAAQRDGIITAAERSLILQIAHQLSINDAAIPAVTPTPQAEEIPPEARVCFTGTAIVDGKRVDKSELQKVAKNAGLQPVSGVTKSGCDLLVAADVSTLSSKASKAKKWGIPVLSTHDFLAKYDD